MIWISLILGVIEALPQLITLLKEVVDAIHGHPLQLAHEADFRGILSAYHDDQDPAKLSADLTALKSRL